jgi:hypothetical protein
MGPEVVETKSRESHQSSSSSVAGYVEAGGENEEKRESNESTQRSGAHGALVEEGKNQEKEDEKEE